MDQRGDLEVAPTAHSKTQPRAKKGMAKNCKNGFTRVHKEVGYASAKRIEGKIINRKLTQTQKRHVRELWDEGITVTEIVCHVHSTFPVVQKALEEMGAIQKKPDKKGTPSYLTISGVAKILGLSFKSVASWRTSGQVKFEKLEKNGRWYIHRDNLLSFLESKKLTSFLTRYYLQYPEDKPDEK